MRLLVSVTVAVMILAGGLPAAAENPALTAAQRDEIRALVRETLMANPEIILEAVRRYEKQTAAADESKQAEALSTLRPQLERDPTTPVMGNVEGSVTMVEFFDYNCGYCKRVFPSVQKLIDTDGDVRLAMKEFPILGPASTYAAKAAMASVKQGKYGEFHTALMALRGGLSEQSVQRTAEKVGLDVAQLKIDMESDDVAVAINRNIALAQALGIRGTPAFVVGNQLTPGAVSLERLQAMIDSVKSQPKG